MKLNVRMAGVLMMMNIVPGLFIQSIAQKVEWVSTTATSKWKQQKAPFVTKGGTGDVVIQIDKPLQRMEGFGACFNELGWTSLNSLSTKDKEQIFSELFTPGKGANFSIFRMPVGANDFSLKWYSYNEAPEDFEMRNFSIANDMNTLVPFIKSALKYNPKLKLWASPWSPPTWMKYNKHYAGAAFPKGGATSWRDLRFNFAGLDNGIKPGQTGKAGTDMFIQEPAYTRRTHFISLSLLRLTGSKVFKLEWLCLRMNSILHKHFPVPPGQPKGYLHLSVTSAPRWRSWV